MTSLLRPAAVALAALALCAPGLAEAAPATSPGAAAPSAAPQPGFVPVASFSLRESGFWASSGWDATDRPLVSPADGVAYVGGVTPDGVARVVRADRTARGATTRDVPLPTMTTTAGSRVRLAAAGGRTYALVTMLSGPVGQRLFAVDGTAAREITLPRSVTDGVELTSVAADGATSVWLTGRAYPGPSSPPGLAVFHGDGSTWTRLPLGDHTLTEAQGTYAVGGHYFENYQGQTTRSLGSDEWTGSAWVNRGNTAGFLGGAYATLTWTFASPGEFTRWGYSSVQDASATTITGFTGACNGTGQAACKPPSWPVSAAARLADGAVVLGGADTVLGKPSVAPAGFAVVPKPGAAPVPLAGDNGAYVSGLAAAPAGRTVWALTCAGTTATLQVMTEPQDVVVPPRPPKKHLPKPKPPKRHCHPRHH